MPELKTRANNEEDVAAALMLVWRDYLPDIPGLDWGSFTGDTADALIEPLARAYSDAANNLAAERGIILDQDVLASSARDWATLHAGELATELTLTTQRDFANVGETADVTQQERLAALLAILGLTRLESIAITEVTGAISAGEQQAAKDYELETDTTLRAIWHTEEDGRVCEICEPLDGTGVEIYGMVSVTGPPAHPNCRCWLDYEETI